jgi:hypothetical protein
MCLIDWDFKWNWIFCIDFQLYCEFSARCHCNVILGYRSSKIEGIKIWPFRVAKHFTVYRNFWGLCFCLCMSSKSYGGAHRLICFHWNGVHTQKFEFSGALQSSLRAPFTFIMSVRPPVRLVRRYQQRSHWANFLKILYWELLWKYVDEIQICLKCGKNIGILLIHKEHSMFHCCRRH